MNSDFYDAEYYLTGPASGKSNYENYSWKPDLTLPMADWLKRILHIKNNDKVLDFGCARGYLVKALRMRGVNAYGCDSSEWAIENCDEGVRDYVSQEIPDDPFDHIIMKDVAEHICLADLWPTVVKLVQATRKSLLMIVPLSWSRDAPFLRDEDNADPSHINAWPLTEWIDFLSGCVPTDAGYVTGSWHYPGLKPASSEVPKSCGFIQFTRV